MLPRPALALSLLVLLTGGLFADATAAPPPGEIKSHSGLIRAALESTTPLTTPRGPRLPLFVLPLSQSLAGLDDARAEAALRELDLRGLGYTVAWNPADFTNSLREAFRIARFQQRIGMHAAVDATACLMSFHDGTDATAHMDDAGHPFHETSFGGKLGCPFALDDRRPIIAARVERFARAYRDEGLPLDFVCADWEVDGPIEWNGAWASSKKCRRCRESVPEIEDFRRFQQRLRSVRSELQRQCFALPILRSFPRALVGNYGVHPHDGYRYWYDYFEQEVVPGTGIPLRSDGRARYREWAHEFAGSGYTFANPVLYTWYRTFGWYDDADPDFRWFRNLLLEGSGAGRHTPRDIPLVPFVHWTTTNPPKSPDSAVRQFSAGRYQDLLRHLLLRGHDSFFLWCRPEELATELRLLHPVYAESLRHHEFLQLGTPVNFEVPESPSTIISGLRLGNQVLALRTEFNTPAPAQPVTLSLAQGGVVSVPPRQGFQLLTIEPPPKDAGLLTPPATAPQTR